MSVDEIGDHEIHREWAELRREAAKRINETTLAGGRVIGVGTTTARTLEWAATGAQGLDPYDVAACPWQRVAAFAGDVDIFIHPGYRFRAVDTLPDKLSLAPLIAAYDGQCICGSSVVP